MTTEPPSRPNLLFQAMDRLRRTVIWLATQPWACLTILVLPLVIYVALISFAQWMDQDIIQTYATHTAAVEMTTMAQTASINTATEPAIEATMQTASAISAPDTPTAMPTAAGTAPPQ